MITEFDKALYSLENTKGLIIDLRNTVSGGNSYVARGIMSRFIDKDLPYQKHVIHDESWDNQPKVGRSWVEYVSPRGKQYKNPVVILVGKWTGSMGEGLAIGFEGMERAQIVGTEMEQLAGAIYNFDFKYQKFGYQLSQEKLYHINGTPREKYIPTNYVKQTKTSKDEIMEKGVEIIQEKKMKTLISVVILFSCNISFAQCDKDLNMFNHYSVVSENDTIEYHTYAKKSIDSLNTILLYIQGSKASSLYQVERKNGVLSIGTTVPIRLKTIPKNYLFVLISKKGIPFCTKMDEEIKIPESYYTNQTLDYRVFQANEVLKNLSKKHNNHFKQTIALGHSEGSDVVAKLGTVNNDITHFGYLSGGGYTQFLDFVTYVTKKVDKGEISEEEAQIKINSTFNDIKEIMANPNATDKYWKGKNNSYNRWSHFSEPPINNLLKIDKPIFVAIGTKDKAVAVESAYLIPIEFIRHKKDNLTFKAYPYLDHGFGKKLENGEYERHWNVVFKDFINWVEK